MEPRRPPDLVSVVIPVLNGADTIGEQLDALAAQDYAGAWELIVADNGSTDTTTEVVRAHVAELPAVRVVDAADRPGSSHARNVGARQAAGSLLVFCDADDVVVPGWLTALVDASTAHDLVTGEEHEDVINDPDVAAWRPPRVRGGLPTHEGYLPYAPSCNLGVWADVFSGVGGFSDDYAQAHDVEFSWRAQLAGHGLGFAPGAVVHYRYRSDLAGVARQARRMGEEVVQLYRDHRDHGMPRSSTSAALRRWAWLVVRLPRLADRRGRGEWLRRANESLGRLRGSIRHRVWYP